MTAELVFPASFAQQRLWFVDRLEPGAPTYNVPLAFHVSGPLDVSALEWSLNELVRRHEILRTTFTCAEQGHEPLQVIAAYLRLTLATADLSGLPATERAEQAHRLAREEGARPFDLARGPLVRATLVSLDAEEHLLLLTFHHIVSDGWSCELVQRELTALYAGRQSGQPSPLPELDLQYADYAVWQRESLRGEGLERQLTYWRRQLAGAPDTLDLPTDRPRPGARTPRGAIAEIELPASLRHDLHALARGEQATLFMLLLAAFQSLLARYTGQEDLVVASPVAGRTRPEGQSLIGFFVNVLLLRADVSGDPTFRVFLQQMRDVCLGAYANQDVPFEQLVETLRPGRQPARPPFMGVSFLLQHVEACALSFAGTAVRQESLADPVEPFDLTLIVEERAGGLTVRARYSVDLFDAPTIRRLLEHYRVLLDGIVADPDRPLSALPLLTEAELRQLVAWNNTWTDFGEEPPIHRLFEAQAARTPGAVAIRGSNQALTFDEVNRAANRLADNLRQLGVGPEVAVAVCLERVPAVLVSLLGVLKAGGAYVPLDPDQPRERLAFVVEDTQAAVLVTQASLLIRLPTPQGLPVVCLAENGSGLTECASDPDNDGECESDPRRLACVIYTSGTTGRPKGVLLEHGGLANFFRATAAGWDTDHSFRFSADDVVLAVAPFNADIALFEMLVGPLNGGVTQVVPRDVVLDPGRLALELTGATVLVATPGLMQEVVERIRCDGGAWTYDHVRALFVGGEAVPPTLLAALRETFPHARLFVGGGPTETSVSCAGFLVGPDQPTGTRHLWGRPLPNVTALVCDRYGQPLPVGIPGELYIGGAGVARGYLNLPELTAERFVTCDGVRYYRTGDRVRRMPDGLIEFVGRMDRQVKLRGFRVELGEVESVLAGHEGVRQAVVVAREETPGDKRLAAYVVPKEGRPPSNSELRTYLADRLPNHAVPASVTLLNALPLTPNGKVDYGVLPSPHPVGSRPAEAAPAAPQSPVEELLAEIWSELLGVERVGAQDNFFDLGGHSLLAMRLLFRIREALDVDLPVRTLFEAPTVAGLAERVQRARGAGMAASSRPSPRPERDRRPPLSHAQERLRFLDQLEPGQPTYSVPTVLRLTGELNVAALRRSLAALVRRHEALRTSFLPHRGTGAPYQVIAARARVRLAVEDLRPLNSTVRATEASRRLRDEARRPFNLERGPLFRASLLRLADAEHLLVMTLHHIVADEWSMGVLFRELAAVYRAYMTGEVATLPDLPIQPADFAAWQRAWLQGEELDQQLRYWTEHLAGVPTTLSLPTDSSRSATLGRRGASETELLPAALATRLKALGRREGATLYMTLLAAFEVLLGRYTGQEAFVVGSPIAGRRWPELEGLISFFVNTLPLRADLSGDPSFRELLRRVRATTLAAYDHQDLPFERLVEALQPTRESSRAPLVQVLIGLHSAADTPDLPGLTVQLEPIELGTTKFDLSLVTTEVADGLEVRVVYDRDLFQAATIRRLLGQFRTLLEAIVADPGRRVGDLPLLTEAERHQALVLWNQTSQAASQATCVHRLIEAQASRTPDAVAVVYEDRELTYRELDQRANQLAHHLRQRGVGPEVRVGLCVERSLDMVVGLLGILKAGGAYVPMDPAYPKERLAFMLADSRAPVLLTEQRLLAHLPVHAAGVVCLDTDWRVIAQHPNTSPPDGADSGNLAYLIYTSGSTGQPKGVAIEHRHLCNYLDGVLERLAPSPEAAFAHVSTFAADLGHTALFPALCTGGRLHVIAQARLTNPGALADYFRRHRIDYLKIVPSHLAALIEATDPAALLPRRALILGGDAADREWVARLRRLAPECAVYNHYGPTETTVGVLMHHEVDESVVTGQQGSSLPLGHPLVNTRVYVLDRHLNPVPTGVSGELYVGGNGVGRGYYGRPDLTADRFIPDPYGPDPGARLYRTGDRARHLPDGTVEFLGRLDHQVKIRGFRVELREVETVLAQHPAVREAVAVVREDTRGDKRLVAYFVARPDAIPASHALRRFLEEFLPDAMIPAVFVPLPALPLTPNGKVDRDSLPKPAATRERVARTGGDPRDRVELDLARIWERLLGIRSVDVRDNFFDLGGHSLLAVRLLAQVQAHFGQSMPVATLFQVPTIEEMASVIRRGEARVSLSPIVALERGVASRRPFFCVHPVGGGVVCYAELARHLGPDQPFYGLQAPGLDTSRRPHTRLSTMAKAYVRAIRKVQPVGPYLLGGWSFGGIVALEMARQLQQQEQAVALLALLDSRPPYRTNAHPDDAGLITQFTGDLAAQFGLHFELTPEGPRQSDRDEPARRVLDHARRAGVVPADTGVRSMRRLFDVFSANIQALQTYRAEVSPHRLTVFRAGASPLGDWAPLTSKGVELFEVPGDHYSMLRPPHVGTLAEQLGTCIARASVA